MIIPPAFAAGADIDRLADSYRFLVSKRDEGGVLYTVESGPLRGKRLPLSFYDSAEYWGAHVCRPKNSCAVIDVYDPADYSLKPQRGLAGDLQTERINVHNGTNIYDAATWQIAVMLGAVNNRFKLPEAQDPYSLIQAQNESLSHSRALTRGDLFRYNGRSIDKPQHAYSFRMTPRSWLSADPLLDTRYAGLVRAQSLPGNPDYRAGKASWTDWKPITGENTWAFLLGPLHAAYLHHVRAHGKTFVPLDDTAVQNALAVLPTFAAMQSQLGGAYYAPAGTLANRGDIPVNRYEVSVENNFSLYAGLKILDATLRNTLSKDSSLAKGERERIDAALKVLRAMIHGGRHGERDTAGLLSFFKNAAWREGEFVQGGLADDPTKPHNWTPYTNTRAVDVNTWGIAALGAMQVDQWFGFGASYKTWQRVKSWGAYGTGSTLWGVGFSNLDGNGLNAGNTYRQGVLSAEWTAGAINMVRNMIALYETMSVATAYEYVQELKKDERAMLQAVQTLRLDRYAIADFPEKPARYSNLIALSTQPYLYASKRYSIPFGWYANPLPSTCSTAWMIMLANHFDPFGYGGKTVNRIANTTTSRISRTR